VEKLESRGLGRYSVHYMGSLLWLLLVEGHRHEPHDLVQMVAGHGSQGLRCVMVD